MKREVASIAAVAAFSTMLVGTSKPREDTPSPKASGSVAAPTPSVAAPAPSAPWTIPDARTWKEQKLAKARLSIRVPPGAKVESENYDATRDASFFRLAMPGGLSVGFGEKNATPPIDVERERKYQAANPRVQIVYSQPDALIVTGHLRSRYCEVTACGSDPKRRLCVNAVGMEIDGPKTTKMSDEECQQIVAVVRSIKAAR